MVVDNLIQKAKESPDGWVDFVAECAAPLPMHNINDMMGIPDGQRQEAAEWMMKATSWGDPEYAGPTKDDAITMLFDAVVYMHDLAGGLIEERRANPGPDLFSSLCAAEVDGEQLTDHEIGSFFVLLTIAGNDTTRQSLAHGSGRSPRTPSSAPGCWRTWRDGCPPPPRRWCAGRPRS